MVSLLKLGCCATNLSVRVVTWDPVSNSAIQGVLETLTSALFMGPAKGSWVTLTGSSLTLRWLGHFFPKPADSPVSTGDPSLTDWTSLHSDKMGVG